MKIIAVTYFDGKEVRAVTALVTDEEAEMKGDINFALIPVFILTDFVKSRKDVDLREHTFSDVSYVLKKGDNFNSYFKTSEMISPKGVKEILAEFEVPYGEFVAYYADYLLRLS